MLKYLLLCLSIGLARKCCYSDGIAEDRRGSLRSKRSLQELPPPPSPRPSQHPTQRPSRYPSQRPSQKPSRYLSQQPSQSLHPSQQPSQQPSQSQQPSKQTCFAARADLDHAVANFDDESVTDIYGGIKDWCFLDTVTDMSHLFQDQLTFNEYIGDWDVKYVENMEGMFQGAESFDRSINKWNVERVTNMKEMFDHAKSFSGFIGQWDVGRVTTMKQMFRAAHEFNSPLWQWNVSSVEDMFKMFIYAHSFNRSVRLWDVSAVTDFRFWSPRKFPRSYCDWGPRIKSNCNVDGMFQVSDCPEKDTPNLTATPPGPFCFECF